MGNKSIKYTKQIGKDTNETNNYNKNETNASTGNGSNHILKYLVEGAVNVGDIFIKDDTNEWSIELMKQLAIGNVYDDLPQRQPSEIRIFLSSTFKDFQLERNYLIEHVYEPLRQFCNEQYQKDFILIDLRWGVTDEATNQNLGKEIFMNEIDKCRNESVGPYFVCFLSHRYGWKFPKSTILENEFELIRNELGCIIPYSSHYLTMLLKVCYELDENTVNKRIYRLKNLNDIMQGLNINDKNECEEELNILAKGIRLAVSNLGDSGRIDKIDRDDYLQSITEQEIRYGLFNENNQDRKCAAFFRNITDLSTIHDVNDNSKSFIDKDGESELHTLKCLVGETLSNQNKRTFEIEWTKSNEFKEPYTREIKEYLTAFGDAFRNIVTTLITTNMNDIIKKNNIYDSEILHHALLCNKLVKQSIGRDDLIKKVQSYLDDESNRKPFIVFGTSGSGKSTILAQTIKNLKGENDVFIYRFMGTTRESSNMKSIMLSILKQLKNIYEDCDEGVLSTIHSDKQDQEIDVRTILKIKERFIKMLHDISTKSKYQKLVIVLDSIDQLSNADYSLEWLICDLPKNIKMIYSVIHDYFDILNKLKDNLEFIESNYLEIDKLHNNIAEEMLENWLSNIDRKLTGTLKDKNVSTQWSFVNELLSKTPQIYPLHIRIIFDIVSKWPSWYKVENEFKSCISTKDTIKYLFKRLETFHGQILFSRCVFYLTLFEYSGISEAELENILSIDDELLNSVFVYHHPPLRRFQIALWLKIKYDLKDYITNKETDGLSVISWFHRSFIEASNEYYEDMFKVGDVKDKLLMNVVDYFTEKYNEIRSNSSKGVRKEFEYKKTKENGFLKINCEKINEINIENYAAFRYTKSQRIKSINTSNYQNVYNKRKLNELANVISMMQDSLNKVELLKEHVYFNYEFMHAKCELKELNFIFKMAPIINKLSRLFSNEQKIHELNEINEIYKHVYPKLMRPDPNLLNIEILSRLNDNKSHFAEHFQKPSGLKMISRRCVEKETERDLFFGDSSFWIMKFYEQFNGDLLFIESTNHKERNTRIDVIDSRTSKFIGSIPFNNEVFHIQIVLNNENTNELNKLTELDGFIYFSNGDSLFNYSFPNDSFNLINSFKTDIEGLLLLNSTHLLVILIDCLYLLNLQNVIEYDRILTEPTFIENNEIQLIESTIPKETVFNSQYLDGVDSISIIVAFKDSDLIKIYKFSNNNEQNLSLLLTIDSIKWSFYGNMKDQNYRLRRESILIDESFMMENMTSTKLNRIVAKFALQHEGVTKIIEVNDKGEFNVVDEINENIFVIPDWERHKYLDDEGRTHKAEVEFDSFKNDKIIFKLRYAENYFGWFIYLYNLEKKSVVSKMQMECCERVNAYLQHGLIVNQQKKKLTFYKINDDEAINELSSVETSFVYFNGIKREMKIKNGKLLRIQPGKRLSIKEIDYLNESKESNINDLIRVNKYSRMYEIDGRHILIHEEEKERMESKFSIVKVNDQKRVKTEVMEGNYPIIGYKNGYLVLFKWDLIVYKIENKQDSFEFKQIFKQYIKGINTDSKFVNKCYFNELKPNRFIITLYDKTNDKIEVRFMEEYDENKLNISPSTVSLNNIQLEHNSGMRCLVTSLNEYLVLYEEENRLIYLIDITGDEIIDSIEMDQGIQSIESILNSNDLIVGCQKSLNYIKYDINSNELNKIRIKEYQQELRWIEIQHEYLFVTVFGDSMEIYKLDEKLKNNNQLRDPFNLVKTVTNVQISTNKEYLIIFTKDKELCVYQMDNFNQIASLYLNYPFTPDRFGNFGIVSNEDYISFKFGHNSSLITFKIIEKT